MLLYNKHLLNAKIQEFCWSDSYVNISHHKQSWGKELSVKYGDSSQFSLQGKYQSTISFLNVKTL